MRNIIIGIVILALLTWGLWALFKPNIPEINLPNINSSQGENLQTYRDPQGTFSFTYPHEAQVSGPSEGALAHVTIARDFEPGTNFSEANMTITRTTGGTDATCSGVTTSKEAAAGNLYETQVTKKLYDGDCYNFTSVIHSTNIGNYDPSQGIKEFDKEKVMNKLEEVIKSFTSQVSSD